MSLTTGRCRSGLSLIEIVAVTALLGMAMAVIGSAILNQQRFHRDTSELLSARQGVRDAMEVLSTDIRGASTADTIRMLADSAVELFAGIGTSVACRAISESSIALASESATGSTLTSFVMEPDTGDFVLFYRDTAGGAGEEWDRYRIAAIKAKSGDPDCVADGVAPGEGFVLTLQSPSAGSVKRGAPVRFVRRGRYSLYKASNSQWYLGYRRCNALGPSVCGAIQPVSGPYRRYNTDEGQTGILFEYYDAQGEIIPDGGSPFSAVRVDVTARVEKAQSHAAGGLSAGGEAATGSIAIRNR